PVVDCAKEGALAKARLAATAAASVRNGNAKLFFMLGTLVITSRPSGRGAREVGWLRKRLVGMKVVRARGNSAAFASPGATAHRRKAAYIDTLLLCKRKRLDR